MAIKPQSRLLKQKLKGHVREYKRALQSYRTYERGLGTKLCCLVNPDSTWKDTRVEVCFDCLKEVRSRLSILYRLAGSPARWKASQRM